MATVTASRSPQNHTLDISCVCSLHFVGGEGSTVNQSGPIPVTDRDMEIDLEKEKNGYSTQRSIMH